MGSLSNKGTAKVLLIEASSSAPNRMREEKEGQPILGANVGTENIVIMRSYTQDGRGSFVNCALVNEGHSFAGR
jgi:hypothetical protein